MGVKYRLTREWGYFISDLKVIWGPAESWSNINQFILTQCLAGLFITVIFLPSFFLGFILSATGYYELIRSLEIIVSKRAL